MATTAISGPELRYVSIGRARIAYRLYGPENEGLPLVMLSRFQGTMDDWDPALISLLAERRQIVVFDNAGVGLSEGSVQESIAGMADTAIGFIEALGFATVDLLGFSMGGYIAQRLVLKRPELVHALVLVGTGPGGGEGVTYPGPVVAEYLAPDKTPFETYRGLFFTDSGAGAKATRGYLERTHGPHRLEGSTISDEAAGKQRQATGAWWAGEGASLPELDAIRKPVLVVSGSKDVMVPTPNSFLLAQRLSDAQLIIYPDAGHGSLFQYPRSFSRDVSNFLASLAEGGIS